MPKVSVKHKCGDNVNLGGVEGKVTAIFIRGRGRTYEFSYIDNSGNPTSINAQECELEVPAPKHLGFSPQGHKEQKNG